MCNLHDILLSSEETFQKKKYEFDCMFTCISLDERKKHWVIYKDYTGKVLNIFCEFHTAISNIENLSNNKVTLRAGGQNLRSRQLSEIRTIYKMLGIDSLHAAAKVPLDDHLVSLVKEYI